MNNNIQLNTAKIQPNHIILLKNFILRFTVGHGTQLIFTLNKLQKQNMQFTFDTV